ncbi:T9SS type A sorting domain-containing protein [Aurantibacillus circumpalustris]|uniref:T9SS type A sorting domain-containing protein n=1 Tax=Aurantibacillus circumpalustris TaxID=3036359 RepID=UPI00295BDB8E|nr:T9SS type A sorting domain-containing protein [Aurantibacillus circumpalustris]
MRKFLPLVFLLLSLQSLISQNLNSASHTQIDKVGNIVSINSKCYYLKEVENCCGRDVRVIGIGENGVSFFNTSLNYYDGYLNKIMRTADNHLLFYGIDRQACDVSGLKDFIVKIDTNGALIFKMYLQSNWVNSQYISVIAAAQDSSFYLASDGVLEKYSASGQYILSTLPGVNNIKSICSLINGNLIIHGKINNANVNVEYNPLNDVIINQQNTAFIISKFEKTANGNFVALSVSGELIRYDSALNFISQATVLTNSNISISDFTTRNDSIFVTGTQAVSNFPFYGVLNSGFNLLNYSQPAYKGIHPSGIAVTNKNKINIVTNSSANSYVTFTSLNHFAIYDGFSCQQDIGVVGVKGLNSIIKHPAMYKYMPIADIEVVVKNFGADTVSSFFLNSYFVGTHCPFVLHKYYPVSIAPGATVSLQTGTFEINAYFISTPVSSPGSIVKVKTCLFTTIPNASNDINIDNDAFCDSVLFTVVTGLKENTLLTPNIQIYPNPSDAGFTISSDFEIKAFELINSLGQIIRKESINAKEYYINASTLIPGIYFMKLETEKGIVQKKIIKN